MSDAGGIEGQSSVSNSKIPGGGMRREVEGVKRDRMAGRKAGAGREGGGSESNTTSSEKNY